MLNIYSIHYKDTRFLELQYRCFNKFMSEFKWTCINNARDPIESQKIEDKANELGVESIKTNSDAPFSLCGLHHQQSLNWVWSNIISKQSGPCIICDGDVFLLEKFNLDISLNGHPLAGVFQNRKGYEYLSPTLIFMNLDILPNKDTISWLGTEVSAGAHLDSGGDLYYYLKDNPSIKQNTKQIFNTWHISDDNKNLFVLPESIRSSYESLFEVEIYDDIWLHFCRSSGWSPGDHPIYETKMAWVKNFVDKRINNEVVLTKTGFNISEPRFFGWKR